MGSHRWDSLRHQHRLMHAGAYPLVKAAWSGHLKSGNTRKVGGKVYGNPNQRKPVRTIAAIIVLATIIGIACAAGLAIVESIIAGLADG